MANKQHRANFKKTKNNIFKKKKKSYSTILGCLSSFKIEISLIAVEGIPSSSFSNLIFFNAIIYFDS